MPAEVAAEQFPITRHFRTIHSINDRDVEQILNLVTPDARVILDWGCHFGHLSFELAARFDALILSVDNFTGTAGDALMSQTIRSMTANGRWFLPNFIDNMERAASAFGGFRGRIVPLLPDQFAALDGFKLDFAFIDGSHGVEEADVFPMIADRLRPGAILGGHDFDLEHPHFSPGVIEGVRRIEPGFEWICRAYTWFMRKRA